MQIIYSNKIKNKIIDMEENKQSGILFDIPKDKTEHLIKVIGVGGGGGNAVKSMYEKGVKNVSFAYCNTDSQALSNSPIPVRIQLGEEGLGVGGDPVLGREKAEESMNDIELLFNDETKMVFLTAGMGGGTGTGAAPLIAKIARGKGYSDSWRCDSAFPIREESSHRKGFGRCRGIEEECGCSAGCKQ